MGFVYCPNCKRALSDMAALTSCPQCFHPISISSLRMKRDTEKWEKEQKEKKEKEQKKKLEAKRKKAGLCVKCGRGLELRVNDGHIVRSCSNHHLDPDYIEREKDLSLLVADPSSCRCNGNCFLGGDDCSSYRKIDRYSNYFYCSRYHSVYNEADFRKVKAQEEKQKRKHSIEVLTKHCDLCCECVGSLENFKVCPKWGVWPEKEWQQKILIAYHKRRRSGCFITTAVCGALNKPDNCPELNRFRYFRDTFMQSTPEMQSEVKDYYRIAPEICARIDSLGKFASKQKYAEIWKQFLKPAFDVLNTGDNKKTYEIYKKMVLELVKEWSCLTTAAVEQIPMRNI